MYEVLRELCIPSKILREVKMKMEVTTMAVWKGYKPKYFEIKKEHQENQLLMILIIKRC